MISKEILTYLVWNDLAAPTRPLTAACVRLVEHAAASIASNPQLEAQRPLHPPGNERKGGEEGV